MANVVQSDGEGGALKISETPTNVSVQNGDGGPQETSPVNGTNTHVATDEDVKAAEAEAAKQAGAAPEGDDTTTGGDDTVTGGEGEDTVQASEDGTEDSNDDTPERVDLTDPRLQSVQDEWDKTGAVSKESRTKLAKELGVTEEMVDFTIAGLEAKFNAGQAELNSQADAIRNEFGGEEGYKEFVLWARDNLTEEQIEAYDSLEAAGNLKAAHVMVKAFKADYEAAGNQTRRDIVQEGDKGDLTPNTQAFASEGEMLEAMADPRYQTDSAYRATVDAKIGAM